MIQVMINGTQIGTVSEAVGYWGYTPIDAEAPTVRAYSQGAVCWWLAKYLGKSISFEEV